MLHKSKKAALALSLLFLAFVTQAGESLKELSGQLALKNAREYSQNYITGGQPSLEDLKKLADAKVKLVVNLRGEGEFSAFDEQEAVEKLGMKYVSLPVASAGDITPENIKKFHQLLAENDGSVLVHCASGNRVGAFFALEAFQFKNKTAEQALAIGQQTGLTRLKGHVKDMMQAGNK
ncbi:protein tyrosine phosphatase family protein [Thalassomonas viridans]|uniref:Protein tyrosine phosphatase family protein n=1 Tax=Thalassomonas viridans TaxID=137584 RepID=A0AAE9Z869_9GAMM|nr:protein tyrosine phosphatase family protein [Thalassomonas viridans]WDE08481.1 protein tyrosine phosphatase family protein [Thalassomonas viridans]